MVPVCASMCHCKWQFFQTYQTCNDPCHKSRRLWQIPGGVGSHRPVPRFPNLMLSCPKAGEIRMPRLPRHCTTAFSVLILRWSWSNMIQHDLTIVLQDVPRCSKMFQDVPRCSTMFQVAIFKKSSKSTFSTCWTSTIISGGASCGNLTLRNANLPWRMILVLKNQVANCYKQVWVVKM